MAESIQTVEKVFTNVAEQRPLYDTVLVSPYFSDNKAQPGWFTTMALFGAQSKHYFFNVRNRQVGLPYNNQDKRDALPYAMRMESFGVTFFAPSIRNQYSSWADGTFIGEQTLLCDWWEKELPRHCSIEFVVMQDEHISCNCLATPPGYGPVGGGLGRGDIDETTPYTPRVIKGQATQGVPDLENRWPFPKTLDVPRDGNLYAVIQPSEYARGLLQSIEGPKGIFIPSVEGGISTGVQAFWSCFGIQVSIFGETLIQQRGQYHR